MLKIKKGDEVVIITGKDKGRRGNVLKVISDDRVVVENINMVKRHTKPNPNAGQPGGIIDKEMPINVSNVMLWNADAGKGDRVGFKVLEDGRKVRIFRSTGEVVDAT
jgi:large subunit ribosomal protein L24